MHTHHCKPKMSEIGITQTKGNTTIVHVLILTQFQTLISITDQKQTKLQT